MVEYVLALHYINEGSQTLTNLCCCRMQCIKALLVVNCPLFLQKYSSLYSCGKTNTLSVCLYRILTILCYQQVKNSSDLSSPIA